MVLTNFVQGAFDFVMYIENNGRFIILAKQ